MEDKTILYACDTPSYIKTLGEGLGKAIADGKVDLAGLDADTITDFFIFIDSMNAEQVRAIMVLTTTMMRLKLEVRGGPYSKEEAKIVFTKNTPVQFHSGGMHYFGIVESVSDITVRVIAKESPSLLDGTCVPKRYKVPVRKLRTVRREDISEEAIGQIASWFVG